MVRHTTPMVADGVCYGRTDLDVARTFEPEAEAVLAQLPDTARIVSSPLKRCIRLADHLSRHRQIPVEIDVRLVEMNFGAWEGLAWTDVPRPELEAWASDFFNACPHGGESVAELKARVDEAVDEIRSTDRPTVIVTHAGVIRAALAKGEQAHHFQTEINFGGMIHLPQTNEVHR